MLGSLRITSWEIRFEESLEDWVSIPFDRHRWDMWNRCCEEDHPLSTEERMCGTGLEKDQVQLGKGLG